MRETRGLTDPIIAAVRDIRRIIPSAVGFFSLLLLLLLLPVLLARSGDFSYAEITTNLSSEKSEGFTRVSVAPCFT